MITSFFNYNQSMNMKTIILIIIGLIIDIAFIINDDRHHNSLSILLKTLAALSFVLVGILGLKTCANKELGILIVIALVFDLIGDFILILRNVIKTHQDLIFVLGTLSFMIAHFIFIYFFLKINSNTVLFGLIVDAIIFVIINFKLIKNLNVEGKMKRLGQIYTFIILLTTGMSISLLFSEVNTVHILLTLGSFIFTLSDLILIYQKFGKEKRDYLQPLYRITYFISQMIIALSIYFL